MERSATEKTLSKNWVSIPVRHVVSRETGRKQVPLRVAHIDGRGSGEEESVFLSESTCVLEGSSSASSISEKSASSSDKSALHAMSSTSSSSRLKSGHFRALAEFQREQENVVRQHWRHHYSKIHQE